MYLNNEMENAILIKKELLNCWKNELPKCAEFSYLL